MTRTRPQHVQVLANVLQQISLLRYSLDLIKYINEGTDHYLPDPPERETFFVAETYCMEEFQLQLQYFSNKQIEAINNEHHQQSAYIGKIIKRAKAWLVLPGARQAVEYLAEHNPEFKALCEKDQFYETLLREHEEREKNRSHGDSPQDGGRS